VSWSLGGGGRGGWRWRQHVGGVQRHVELSEQHRGLLADDGVAGHRLGAIGADLRPHSRDEDLQAEDASHVARPVGAGRHSCGEQRSEVIIDSGKARRNPCGLGELLVEPTDPADEPGDRGACGTVIEGAGNRGRGRQHGRVRWWSSGGPGRGRARDAGLGRSHRRRDGRGHGHGRRPSRHGLSRRSDGPPVELEIRGPGAGRSRGDSDERDRAADEPPSREMRPARPPAPHSSALGSSGTSAA
jgi:hypothetical protein